MCNENLMVTCIDLRYLWKDTYSVIYDVLHVDHTLVVYYRLEQIACRIARAPFVSLTIKGFSLKMVVSRWYWKSTFPAGFALDFRDVSVVQMPLQEGAFSPLSLLAETPEARSGPMTTMCAAKPPHKKKRLQLFGAPPKELLACSAVDFCRGETGQ